jgi:hypothetical protein
MEMNVMEPKENLLADAMFEIMQRNMPENGEIYWKTDVRWGAIWQEMRVKVDDLLAIPLPTLEKSDHPPNDIEEGSSWPPRPAWLDSPLAPTDQEAKDYRKSFLLHPVDSLAERIRGEGYHTRIESYREAAIRLYNQDAHTTAEYAKEVMLHAVTKHELKQAQDWMAENS